MSRRSSESGTESGGVETAGHSTEQHSRYLLPDQLRHVCRNSHGRYSGRVVSAVLSSLYWKRTRSTRLDFEFLEIREEQNQPDPEPCYALELRPTCLDPTCYEHMALFDSKRQKAKGVRCSCRWGGRRQDAKYGAPPRPPPTADGTPEEAETRARGFNEACRRRRQLFSRLYTV
jgi:hypothetical protein